MFVNGKPAGSHKGGFQAFCFDITPLLVVGKNVIAVKATNAPNNEIAPLAGDFNVQGGLYRDAKLIVTDRLAISPLYSGSNGVFVSQDQVSQDSAKLSVRTIVRNSDSADVKANVNCQLVDADGKNVASVAVNPSVLAASDSTVSATITIPKPHLWNGKADPYLYKMIVTVTGEKGVADVVSVPVGIRFYSVDPDKGFFLNGHSYPLHGVNRHQDKAGKGWAITTADMDEDMVLCKELGINAIRLAHYQHAQHFYDLCDENGIIVWAELCMVNKIDPSAEFRDTTKQQLRELINQNFNHPSICFWSLYNELHLTGKDEAVHEKELAFVSELNSLAHELDPTRLTTAASNEGINAKMNWIPDIIGINRYDGWYAASPDNWPKMLDKMHADQPNGKIGISEYGAGGSIHQHGLIATTQPLNHFKVHPEEGEAYIHEKAWSALRDRPWLWGTFIWNFADFGVAGRNEGDTPGINDKGLITFDRKTKKDAFYLYKAAWSDEPVIHIVSFQRDPARDNPFLVHIYTNGRAVELKWNGKTFMINPTDNPNIFISEIIPLDSGDNDISATADYKGQRIEEHLTVHH